MPKIIVSNTTPIITLLGLSCLNLLKYLYQKIMIPQAVWQEVEEGKHKSFYADLTSFDWIEVKTVQNQQALGFVMNELDKGEAETIVLAKEIGADLVIIDEKLGRNYATLQGLICTGTLGILLKAKENGLIEAVLPYLTKMEQNGIWLGEKVQKIYTS